MFVKDVQGDESSKLLAPCQTESLSILLKVPWHLKGSTSAEYSRFVSVPTDIINALERLFYDGVLVFLGFDFIVTSLSDEEIAFYKCTFKANPATISLCEVNFICNKYQKISTSQTAFYKGEIFCF